MARTDGLSNADRPPLRLLHTEGEEAKSAESPTREEQLARTLNQRLDSRLSRIRASLTAEPQAAETPSSPNPPGTGQRLDILA